MLKRMLSLLMVILMLPVFTLAETAPMYQVFTFAGALPERLREPLSAMIFDTTLIVSGAAIQYTSNFYEADEPASWDSYSAMLLVDTDEGPLLLAAAWVDGLPWQVNDFTHLLRAKRNVSISVYQPEPNRIPQFSVDYVKAGSFVSDLMIFRGNRLWQLAGHINEATGVSISIGIGDVTVNDAQGQDTYTCSDAYWLEYLDSIDTFPTYRAEVETLDFAAGSILSSNTAAGRAYTEGANLREEPTSKSASLGMYNKYVPLTLTGEQEPGTQWPWKQVRIGNTLGWMSANYIMETIVQDYPVPLGRTVDGCPLYAAIGDTQPAMQLEPGATFHILTEIDGLYHICIPQGEISWEVDRNGVYGYIPVNDILTGYSPSALDALESAQ